MSFSLKSRAHFSSDCRYTLMVIGYIMHAKKANSGNQLLSASVQKSVITNSNTPHHLDAIGRPGALLWGLWSLCKADNRHKTAMARGTDGYINIAKEQTVHWWRNLGVGGGSELSQGGLHF